MIGDGWFVPAICASALSARRRRGGSGPAPDRMGDCRSTLVGRRQASPTKVPTARLREGTGGGTAGSSTRNTNARSGEAGQGRTPLLLNSRFASSELRGVASPGHSLFPGRAAWGSPALPDGSRRSEADQLDGTSRIWPPASQSRSPERRLGEFRARDYSEARLRRGPIQSRPDVAGSRTPLGGRRGLREGRRAAAGRRQYDS